MDVRIERSLRQEIGTADLLRLLFEDIDEQTANRLPLRLRIGDAFKLTEEARGGIDMNQRDVEGAAEELDDIRRLVGAHQAVIDEDAGQLIADRLVDQHCGDG